MAFKEKHRRRLEEVEAEEKAAASQDLVSDEDAPEPEQKPLGRKRPVRPIRSARVASIDLLEAPAPKSSRDLEGGSPPPARRGGRGAT